MSKINHWLRANLDLIANVLLGIGAFVAVCGYRALNFTNTRLAMAHELHEDLTMAHLASVVYRSEPFAWNIFRIHSLNPPDGITGATTDLNPLWSLLFKFFRLFGFDPYWQTVGLLAFVSFVLTGIAAAYIFRHVFRERKDWWLVSIASLFFIFSPVMLIRIFGHVNLTLQWIFLFAFALYLNGRLTFKEWIMGAILLVLSVGMHPYFLPMTVVPLGALALKQLSEKSISPRVFIQGAIFWSAVIVVMALLLLPLNDMKSAQHGGYGFHSMNLNALFNPIWTGSRIIPASLGQGEGQAEGDNYFGFGLLVLLVLSIPAIRAFHKDYPMTEHRWLLTGCGILLFFALSYRIQLYNFTVFEYNPGITRKFGETFRASGRLFWPCWYFLSYFLIWLLFQTRKNAKYILVALVALQIYDLSPTIRGKHELIARMSNTPYQSAFKSGEWDTLFGKYGNVFLVGDIHENRKMYVDLWHMIPERKIQVNDGYFVLRTRKMQEEKAEENLLKNGVIPARLPGNTIFIFVSKSIAESYLDHAPSLSGHVRELDGIYYLLWNPDLVERQADSEMERS